MTISNLHYDSSTMMICTSVNMVMVDDDDGWNVAFVKVGLQFGV